MSVITNKTFKIILIAALVSGLLMNGCSGGSEAATAIVGERAPDFKLQNLDGESVSLSDFEGKPILINFWATWCGPCAFEMPFLQQVYEEWSGRGLTLLAINVGESSAKVKAFMEKLDLSLPVPLDTKGRVSQQYNVVAYPTTFFIDKDGIIQEKLMGAFPSTAAIEERLSKIMD